MFDCSANQAGILEFYSYSGIDGIGSIECTLAYRHNPRLWTTKQPFLLLQNVYQETSITAFMDSVLPYPHSMATIRTAIVHLIIREVGVNKCCPPQNEKFFSTARETKEEIAC